MPICRWTRDRAFPVFAKSWNERMQRKLSRASRLLADQPPDVRAAAFGSPRSAAAAAEEGLAMPAEPVGALVWVTIRHYEDCKLRVLGGIPHLELRV